MGLVEIFFDLTEPLLSSPFPLHAIMTDKLHTTKVHVSLLTIVQCQELGVFNQLPGHYPGPCHIGLATAQVRATRDDDNSLHCT